MDSTRREVSTESSSDEDSIIDSTKVRDLVLPMQLALVEGPDRLPADEGRQEELSRKLCVLEADLSGVTTLLSELAAQLVSINSVERTIHITFKSFEEVWKFSTYHRMGFLGQCMENLLMDQEFWLISLDLDLGIEISINEETLYLMYSGFLMQGSFFGYCTANQMFDSSTSGSDIYLEKGDIALFEPPFLDSGWTVLSLPDGAKGTKPKPAVEPVIPFHEWFLKSCQECVLVGRTKSSNDLTFQIAVGVCETTEEYAADGTDELSFQSGERISVLGLLVSCFEWFLGRSERTGEIGLVRTRMVKETGSICESSSIFLKGEDRQIVSLDEEKTKTNTIAILKSNCQSDFGTNYKLDLAKEIPGSGQNKALQKDANSLKHKVSCILTKLNEAEERQVSSVNIKRPTENKGGIIEASQGNPRFAVCSDQDSTSSDGQHGLLVFLSSREHQPPFLLLYSAYPEFLLLHFEGHTDEDDIVAYLSTAREIARKRRMSWAQSRICFLLGQLCAGRSKFSQARVYFEEALSAPKDTFQDMFLLSAIYSNLLIIYLTQKNHEKFWSLSERFSALLMAVPDCLFGSEDPEILKCVLRKSVLANHLPGEARVCFLLAKLHLKLNDTINAIPFIERLLILADELPACDDTWSHVFLMLARLYSDQHLPRLAVSCAQQAMLQVGATVSHCLNGVSLLLKHAPELHGVTIPTQIAPFLTRAAALVSSREDPDFDHVHALCLSWLFNRHGMPERAVHFMRTFLDHTDMHHINQAEATASLVWLAWLYICNKQPSTALEVLDAVLSSLPEHCTTHLEGIVHNMRAISFRHHGNIRQAAESYRAAMEICEEFEDHHNWAVALANFGFMCLQVKATRLAEEYLTKSVELFSELEVHGNELSFISVLIELGAHLVSQGNHENGKIYYEWALLVAINIDHIDSQIQATRHLCQLYEEMCPDEAQCIIYHEHQLNLLQQKGDKSSEGEILEKISGLYLNLATDRANRAALDYTKRSLGIFIDLGQRRKEAHAWLQAGKIYHILKQTELVDLYVQVAQDQALSTGDTLFTLEMLEAAGDVYFDSSQEKEKAICFYRDRALPIAMKTSSVHLQLRLCNKLSELLLQLGQYSEATEYAETALSISTGLADRLNERVAFHRLATLYHCLGRFEMAEHHFLKALYLCPSPLQYDEEALYYVRVYQTLGDIIFYDLKDPFDAAGYYHLALAAAMDLGNKRSQLKLCTRLATVYHNFLMDRELSLFFYQRARAFANDLHIRRINLAPDHSFRTTAQYKNAIADMAR